jgi:hypothetical protein
LKASIQTEGYDGGWDGKWEVTIGFLRVSEVLTLSDSLPYPFVSNMISPSTLIMPSIGIVRPSKVRSR